MYIEASEFYVPVKRVNPADNYEQFNISALEGKVYAKIFGIENVLIANENMLELVCKPVEKLFAKKDIDKSTIKYIIHAYTAGAIAPLGYSVVRELSELFNLNPKKAFSTNVNKCVSIYSALDIAYSLLQDEDENARILIVTGELGYTPELRLIPNVSIVGDASGCFLLKKHSDHDRYINSHQSIHGKYARGIWMTGDELKIFESKFINLMANFIKESTKKFTIDLEQLRWIIPHNINIPTWRKVAEALDFPLEKIFLDNVRHFGHCFNSDLPINYNTLARRNLLAKDDLYLCVGAGIGTVFSSILLRH